MKRILIMAVLAFTFAGCYNDKYDKLYPLASAPVCDTSNVSFATDIMPILVSKCNVAGGCHDAAGSLTSNFDFSTYEGFRPIAMRDVIGDITWATNPMPKGLPKLPQCDIDKITRWVNQGGLNN